MTKASRTGRRAKTTPAEALFITRPKSVSAPRAKRGAKSPDVAVSFTEPGRIVFHSPARFSAWNTAHAREFVELSLGIKEVCEVEIDTVSGSAILGYEGNGNTPAVLRKIAKVYQGELAPDGRPTFSPETFKALPKTQPRLRVFRYGNILSTWELRLHVPGWARLRNALILHKRHFAQFIERELMALIGIHRYKVHTAAGSLTVEFDEKLIHLQQNVLHLDMALAKAPTKPKKVKREDAGLPVATISLGLAAASTFAAPALFPSALH